MEILLNDPQSQAQLHYPIADLHCDLLCYLGRDPKRSPYDPDVRCSIPQLKEGNVKLQTMAIFTETSPDSVKSGQAQVNAFKRLLKDHSDVFVLIRQPEQFQELMTSDKIGIMPAIENASSMCDETESLDAAVLRLTSWQRQIGKLSYLSLTWNTENRFGGGALTKTGLKEDGKRLIDYLHQKSIALDFSHASDYLAFDALNYIDKNGMNMRILASHSNFRSVADVPRNLPDDLAKEILKRKGIIGLNFIRLFVGEDSPTNFSKQFAHAMRLGHHQGICFGADFFYIDDVSPAHRKPASQLFFPDFDHAGTYSKVVALWTKDLASPPELMANICYNNLAAYLTQNI